MWAGPRPGWLRPLWHRRPGAAAARGARARYSLRAAEAEELARLARLLEGRPQHVEGLVQALSPETRRLVTVAGIAASLEVNPQTADLNRDGVVSEREMLTWMRLAAAEKHSILAAEEREKESDDPVVLFPPTRRKLLLYSLAVGVPFVGFGVMDNAIMLISGDIIDHHLGLHLGISILASAALGNLISDVAGVAFGDLIEKLVRKLGLPPHNLTAAQHTTKAARWAALLGGMVGVSVGCLLGMFPLLFFETEEEKRLKHIFHTAAIGHRDTVPRAELMPLLQQAGHCASEASVADLLGELGHGDTADVNVGTWLQLVKRVQATSKH